jgi:hypothetical protein
MDTVVYQSYRTTAVPPWIERCMESVRRWAGDGGFAYERTGDAFFDPLPPWFRARVEGDPVRMSDLARLLLARTLLERYERAVWVDADVVVFDPGGFTIDAPEGYAFCREAWLSLTPDGRVHSSQRVNNAVSVFARGNAFLDFYIHACEAMVRRTVGPVHGLALGTRFLTLLHQAMPLPLLRSVALLSPLVTRDVAAGEDAMVRLYMSRFGAPARAANLCASFRGRSIDGIHVDDELLGAAVERLLSTRGEALNRHAPADVVDARAQPG